MIKEGGIMSVGEKRPPLSLDQLESSGEGKVAEDKGKDSGPGELEYASTGGSGKGRSFGRVLLPVVVAVVLAVLFVVQYSASKADIAALNSSVATESTRVDILQREFDSTYTSLVKKSDAAVAEARSAKAELSKYALIGDLPTFEGLALKSDIPSLEGYLTEEDLSGFVTEEALVEGFLAKGELPDLNGYLTEEDLLELQSGWETQGALVRPSLSQDSIVMEVVADSDGQLVSLEILFEPINSDGFWAGSVGIQGSLALAYDYFYSSYPVELWAGSTLLTPQYSFIWGSDIAQVRSIEWRTPWFTADRQGVSRRLDYELVSPFESVNYRVTVKVVPVAVTSLGGGW